MTQHMGIRRQKSPGEDTLQDIEPKFGATANKSTTQSDRLVA